MNFVHPERGEDGTSEQGRVESDHNDWRYDNPVHGGLDTVLHICFAGAIRAWCKPRVDRVACPVGQIEHHLQSHNLCRNEHTGGGLIGYLQVAD